jgi:hypothetical protein
MQAGMQAGRQAGRQAPKRAVCLKRITTFISSKILQHIQAITRFYNNY